MSLYYTISNEIFERFPGYRRGVVVAEGIQNGTAPEELVKRLREAENDLRGQLTMETLTTHPRIAAWREAYRSVGIKPSEFRPSVEALARRVLKGDPLPTINTVVDIGTLITLQHLVPVGAHAIDVLKGDISLRPASGSEMFEPFGPDAMEHPQPGEFVFVEGDTVLTRRWTWRQARHTLMLPETTALEFNIDALPPVDDVEVEQICRVVAETIQAFCGGSTRIEILSKDHPRMQLRES